jgi:hypothetical protein
MGFMTRPSMLAGSDRGRPVRKFVDRVERADGRRLYDQVRMGRAWRDPLGAVLRLLRRFRRSATWSP